MKVHAKQSIEVDIDPEYFIRKMVESELPNRGDWIFEENGKFYLGYEQSAGQHSYDDKLEMTEARYRYIRSLQEVLRYLQDKKISIKNTLHGITENSNK